MSEPSRTPPDIITGNERPPPRWTALLAGLLLVATAIAVGYQLMGRHNDVGEPGATATHTPDAGTAPPTSSPHPTPPGPQIRQVEDAPASIGEIEVVATSGGLIEHAGLDDSTLHTLTEIDASVGQQPVQVWPVSNGVVAYTPLLDIALSQPPANGTVALYRDNSSTPTVIAAEARAVIPALRLDHFWITKARLAPGGSAACEWSLLSVEGVIRDSASLPCSFMPQRETADGFVGTDTCDARTSCAGTLRSSSGQSIADLEGFAVGATNDLVAVWGYTPDGPITLFDVSERSTSTIPLPPGRAAWSVVSAQPSVSGGYLAVSFYSDSRPPTPEVWVYDVRDAQWLYVARGEGEYGETLAWAAEILVVSSETYAAYDPRTDNLYVTELQPRGRPGSLSASYTETESLHLSDQEDDANQRTFDWNK